MSKTSNASSTGSGSAVRPGPENPQRRARDRLWTVLAWSGLPALFRWLNRRRLLIVMYHGVVAEPPDYAIWTQIPAEEFRWQVRHLKRHYRVRPLEEVLAILRRGDRLPPRTAVITFDDGFKNNATVAFPILREAGLPATIFLTTGLIDTDTIYWPDRLFLAFRETERRELDLRDLGLGVLRFQDVRSREAAHRVVKEHLKTRPATEKNQQLATVIQRLGDGDPRPAYRDDFVSMTWTDVKTLHDSGLIAFGGHTVHHEILTRLEAPAMRAEIRDSLAAVRERLGRPCVTFAYPNGSRADFDEAAKAVLEEEGVLGALTTIEALNRPDEDLFELKRVGVGNDTTRARFVLMGSGLYFRLRSLLRRGPAVG